MKHLRPAILLQICVLLCLGAAVLPATAENKPLGHGYDFANNGKRELPCFEAVYAPQSLAQALNTASQTQISQAGLKQALQRQGPILRAQAQKSWRQGSLALNSSHLLQVSQTLLKRNQTLSLQELQQDFDSYLLRGEDGCGNTHFTAYFSPILQVKAKADAEYKYPLYRKPRSWPGGKVLDREQIDQQGKLAGQGLELAYSKSLLDNFFLQVQGSGLAEYLDTGEKLTLQYAGQNGLPYNSLGRHLVEQGYIPAEEISLTAIRDFFEQHPDKLVPFLNRNQSYVFFQKKKQGPKGSLNTEVVPQVSIAVDPTFIPLGAVLLAEVPQLDAEGKFLGHQLRLLVAQDTGGAIRGSGHVDVYMGAGAAAQNLASHLHHYGRLWLLLPKGL